MPDNLNKHYGFFSSAGTESIMNLYVEDLEDGAQHIVAVTNMTGYPLSKVRIKFANWNNGEVMVDIGNLETGQSRCRFVDNQYVSSTFHCLAYCNEHTFRADDRSFLRIQEVPNNWRGRRLVRASAIEYP